MKLTLVFFVYYLYEDDNCGGYTQHRVEHLIVISTKPCKIINEWIEKIEIPLTIDNITSLFTPDTWVDRYSVNIIADRCASDPENYLITKEYTL